MEPPFSQTLCQVLNPLSHNGNSKCFVILEDFMDNNFKYTLTEKNTNIKSTIVPHCSEFSNAFFFWPSVQHVEVPRRGIEPTSQK